MQKCKITFNYKIISDVRKISQMAALWKESPFWFRVLIITAPIACLLLLGLLIAAAVCTLRATPLQPIGDRGSFVLTNSHRPKYFWTSVFWRHKKHQTIIDNVQQILFKSRCLKSAIFKIKIFIKNFGRFWCRDFQNFLTFVPINCSPCFLCVLQ